ncbi:MAG: PAS domain-containing protein [Candidatus Omnitrophota bacterium]
MKKPKDSHGPKKKLSELNIQDALEYTEGIINTVHEPLIILYEDLKVAMANDSFYSTFGVQSENTEGEYIYDLGDGQWDIPELRVLLEEILPKTTSFDHFEVEHDFPGVGKCVKLLNARRIYMKENRTKLIILSIKDITKHKKIEELNAKILELESKVRKDQKKR